MLPPPADSVNIQVISYPQTVILVNRHDGEVRFEPPAPKGGVEK